MLMDFCALSKPADSNGTAAKALAAEVRTDSGRASVLTPISIADAKKDTSHPVIGVLYSLKDDWIGLKNNLENTRQESTVKQQSLCAEAIKKFESALSGKRFGLQPLDLVSIWSVLMDDKDVFPDNKYFRYRVAASLACAYAERDTASAEWKGVFGKVLDISGERDVKVMETKCKGLNLLADDAGNAEKFANGLQEVSKSLQAISRSSEYDANSGDAVLLEILENARNGISMIPSALRNPRALQRAAEAGLRS